MADDDRRAGDWQKRDLRKNANDLIEEPNQNAWCKQTFWIVFFLIVFWPVGIVLCWRSSWHIVAKVLASVAVAFMVYFSVTMHRARKRSWRRAWRRSSALLGSRLLWKRVVPLATGAGFNLLFSEGERLLCDFSPFAARAYRECSLCAIISNENSDPFSTSCTRITI